MCVRADLEQQVVDGGLHLQREAVAGVVLAEGELVVDAEDGHRRDGRARLGALLVFLPTLKDFDLQLLQLRSDRNHGGAKTPKILYSSKAAIP